ncbi:MAG: NFACT family protein [Nanoarchaeota archaeon]
MSLKSLSSMDVSAVVNELQFLVRAKVSQIYHRKEKEFDELLLQLHVSGKGKQLLRIISGKWMCLTSRKETIIKPSGFSLLLRKYLDNAIITSVYQKDAERIVVFELEKEKKYSFIIELFSRGNVILIDEQQYIIGVLEEHTWKDRTLKAKEKYIFPASPVNWKTITAKELHTLLQKSEKKNLATALAMEVGLGGLYAEEICARQHLDKNKLPSEATSKDCSSFVEEVQNIQAQLKHPQGYVYAEGIFPIPLHDKDPVLMMETYSQALDTLVPMQKQSPYEKKIKTIERMIEDQRKAIETQEETIQRNTRKGELIYEQYAPLYKLLEIVKELRKSKEWKDVALELQKEKKIKKVDLKTKRVVIDL